MEVKFTIHYHDKVIKEDIPDLSLVWKKKIKKAIEDKLVSHPEIFGKPLRQSLKGYRKLRVGNYRIIFRIETKKVKIFVIQNRSVVYQTMKHRK